MNIVKMEFPDDHFDAMIGSFVFTVLEDTASALQEIKKVTKQGSTVLLLDIVRSDTRFVSSLQDFFVKLTYPIYNAAINRDLISLVRDAGLQITATENVGGSIVKIIQAITPQ